ncbi:hypothetical protein PF007_g19839 [Phytophthora fragariae]|uniref:PH domain-containing protein n=1 Tax=Phytophthora fragariae TaxID=53985 RepID=A0A6A3R552_9STRA|nr:hypothetical protein PF007_g19839 [Phytophthora fragariae]
MAHMLEARMMSRKPSTSSLTAAVRGGSRRKASISGPSSGGSTVSSTPRSRRPSISRGASSNNVGAAASTPRKTRPKSGAMSTPNLIDLKTITAEEVEWEGYLYKQRKIVKSWTPRYITLQNRTVSVYKSKNHALAKEQHRGRWVIKQILSSLPSAGFGGSKLKPEELGFSFLATNGNLIHFIAASGVEKAMWMHMMQLSLHNTTAREASLLQQGRPRDGPATPTAARSAEDVVSIESSITTHLAEKFLTDLVHLLTATSPDNVIERLPSFLRQLSKDVELLFDLETCETTQPSCVFKGIYHGREGFVHFAALYASKYLLATDVNEVVAHKADDDDHHAFGYSGHRLINTVSGSTTEGKFGLQTTFTPARRISRVVLSFRQRKLMQNVHEHFRNMNVDETIGEHPKAINGKKAPTVANASDESHFDEFSFAYDKTRDTVDDLSMADEGWLVRQLKEGAAMRGRLNASDNDPVTDELGSEDEIPHPILNGQDSSESDEPEVEVTNI